jgi:hypothetical protein
MIGIFATGQMGNQMFEYAFVYSASKKLNTSFFMYGGESLRYFNLYEDLEKNTRRNILCYSVKKLLKNPSFLFQCLKKGKNPLRLFLNWEIKNNLVKWDITFDENNYLFTDIRDDVLYQATFQSEKYFENCKEDIRKAFTIQDQYKIPFLKNKSHLFNKKSIVVHLRRTDYSKLGSDETGGADLILPSSFYKKCLTMIPDTDDCNVIFISDDIEYVKNEFGTKKNYFFENNDSITDFQLMLYADIVIIANSSYSWWGAWLNEKKDKVIYAPNYFLGFNVKKFFPAGIKVDSWNWVDVK